MLDGLPDLFAFVVRLVTANRHRGPLPFCVHYLLEDVANAAQHAATHYFPLTLTEEFLQKSSIGSPYQKWAKFTNDDFEDVAHCLRRLIPGLWKLYFDTSEHAWNSRDGIPLESRFEDDLKGVWRWLYVVFREYECCIVDPHKPIVSLTAINVNDWVNPQTGRFLMFREPPWSPQVDPPPILTKSTIDIADRGIIEDMRRFADGQVRRLRDANSGLARWLQENCTIQDALAPHESTLSEGSFGAWMLDRRPDHKEEDL